MYEACGKIWLEPTQFRLEKKTFNLSSSNKHDSNQKLKKKKSDNRWNFHIYIVKLAKKNLQHFRIVLIVYNAISRLLFVISVSVMLNDF